MFRREYEHAFQGDANWQQLPVPAGDIFAWDDKSTYIKRPPYFDEMNDPTAPIADLKGLRTLALLGDSITTDHISPAGSFAAGSPAGQYLISLGVAAEGFQFLRGAPRQS